jgi:hypothetical protein
MSMMIFTLVMKQHLMGGYYELQTKGKEHREIKSIS